MFLLCDAQKEGSKLVRVVQESKFDDDLGESECAFVPSRNLDREIIGAGVVGQERDLKQPQSWEFRSKNEQPVHQYYLETRKCSVAC